MLPIKRLPLLLLVAALPALAGLVTGCAKEYSYEGGPADSVRVAIDTTPPPPAPPPFLASCGACITTGVLPDSTWQFTVGPSVLCGRADKALMSPGRTSFTFFGPSACSADSGFIASVYLSAPLTGNGFNIHASKVAFYYYDGVTPSYILVSKNTDPFSLIITSYNSLTGLAMGTFSGNAYTLTGSIKEVRNGRFRIQF